MKNFRSWTREIKKVEDSWWRIYCPRSLWSLFSKRTNKNYKIREARKW